MKLKGGTRTIGTVNDRDRSRRQGQLRIELLDGFIIPFGDGAEVDLGEGIAVEHHFAGLNAVDVDDRHDPAHGHRPLHKAVFLELVDLERLASVAPKVTVLAWTCLMPAPEPID